jgi:hypothetical protein
LIDVSYDEGVWCLGPGRRSAAVLVDWEALGEAEAEGEGGLSWLRIKEKRPDTTTSNHKPLAVATLDT